MKSKFLWSTIVTALASTPALAADPFECTVIADLATGRTVLREGICDRRAPPASSFKLPLAAMGFDLGLLKSEHLPVWPYKTAYDAPKRDHKDVDPTVWERDSVLWYSRELTRRMGASRFAAYVRNFHYGNGDVTGAPGKGDGLTHSWLSSSLEISANEQLDFVSRLVRGQLPISPEATALTMAVMPDFEAGDWKVHGKTGSIWLRKADGSFDRNMAVGWFVGWAEKGEKRFAFARLSVGKVLKGNAGPQERDQLLRELPQLVAASD